MTRSKATNRYIALALAANTVTAGIPAATLVISGETPVSLLIGAAGITAAAAFTINRAAMPPQKLGLEIWAILLLATATIMTAAALPAAITQGSAVKGILAFLIALAAVGLTLFFGRLHPRKKTPREPEKTRVADVELGEGPY